MNRPQPKKEINVEALKELCERHLDFIQTYNRTGQAFLGTIWEEAMTAIYGQDVHEWILDQCHDKMVLERSNRRSIFTGVREQIRMFVKSRRFK